MVPGALGIASHREGKDTLSLGHYSHAEGELTQAQGISSHSEGYSTASIGDASHTEGNHSVATGGASHAEGHGTIAKNYAQHADGIFNKGEELDTVHETGIGLSDTERKNVIEMYYDGKVRFPELTFDQQKLESDIAATSGFVSKREQSVIKDGNLEVNIDLETEVNFFIETSSDIVFSRPSNLYSGKKGTIQIDNYGSVSNITFNEFWNSDITDIGINETLVMDYVVLNNDNIHVKENSRISLLDQHLPLLVGNGDFLLINNTDYLVN